MYEDYQDAYPDVGQWDQKPECSVCGKYLSIDSQTDVCESCYIEMCKSGTV